jgi:hypothetical protein
MEKASLRKCRVGKEKQSGRGENKMPHYLKIETPNALKKKIHSHPSILTINKKAEN